MQTVELSDVTSGEPTLRSYNHKARSEESSSTEGWSSVLHATPCTQVCDEILIWFQFAS